MKSGMVLAVLAVLMVSLVIVGCSSVTQNPQVIITKVDPSSIIGDAATVNITFENMNQVDAIITNSYFVFKGPTTSSTSPTYSHSIFIPGDDSKTIYSVSLSGINAVRTACGQPLAIWIYFNGTDAYGYNKAFTIAGIAINAN